MVSWTIKQRRDPHALDRLQRVQEAIYAQIQCLVPAWDAATGTHWVSNVRSGLPLHVEVLGHHPYTSFLRMTHHFVELLADDQEALLASEPEAHVRCYHDMHIAEVTAFDTLQGIRRMAHPSLPSRPLLEMSWQRNRSLEKWLQYLLDQGHCRDTMRPGEPAPGHLESGRKKGLVTI